MTAAQALQLDPDCLDALVAFAEQGLNLTRAARWLHRSQPTVHAQLARLADAVGAPLYQRHGRALILTREGTAVLAYARESRARLAALDAALRGSALEQPVTLATGEGALLYLLGPAIVAFRRETSASPALLLGDRDETLERVRDGRASLGVTVCDGADVRGLSVQSLLAVGTAVVLPRRHPLAARAKLRWEHLKGVPLVIPPRPSALRAAAERALGESMTIAIEARGWPAAMHCARIGLGIAVVNAFCEPPTGCVRRALSDGPTQRYALVWRDGAPTRAAEEALRRAIETLRHR